ncbi:hypothetical protein [Bacillus sp. J33]|uniref:hypothetical protein n=1 Tax=Bacillus sp. J33 TaxID=935836 RepID=UPI0004B30CC1|nr:hypothetical protein [Bacillus sp. J33]
MTSISKLAALIKEDVNSEESLIVNLYSNLLNGLYKLIVWFGVPFLIFILVSFITKA